MVKSSLLSIFYMAHKPRMVSSFLNGWERKEEYFMTHENNIEFKYQGL